MKLIVFITTLLALTSCSIGADKFPVPQHAITEAQIKCAPSGGLSTITYTAHSSRGHGIIEYKVSAICVNNLNLSFIVKDP